MLERELEALRDHVKFQAYQHSNKGFNSTIPSKLGLENMQTENLGRQSQQLSARGYEEKPRLHLNSTNAGVLNPASHHLVSARSMDDFRLSNNSSVQKKIQNLQSVFG